MTLADRLLFGDSRDLLARVPAGTVDLVVTDPPYNIASSRALTMSRGRVVTTAEAWGSWDTFTDSEYHELLGWLFTESFRVLRAGGQVYVWVGARWVSDAIRVAEGAGFRFRAKLVAVKDRPQFNWTRGNWRSAYEECVYFSKGTPRPFHFRGQDAMRNVLTVPAVPKESEHPTEKKRAMLEPLIRASSDRGELVLDPFAGSGSTGVVAQQLGRRYVLIERELRYWLMARERLRGGE